MECRWALLALSQWQKPVLLQVLAWTGHYGLSFFLIFFNSCLAHTLYQMVSAKRVGPLFLRWFKIDFYVAILGLMALIFLYLASLPSLKYPRSLYFCHDAAEF